LKPIDKTASRLRAERAWGRALLPILVMSAASGFATYLAAGFGAWQQLTALLHITVGLGLAVLVPVYVLVHYRRTLGKRRPLMLLSGHLFALGLFTLAASGLYVVFVGQQESQRWVYVAHTYAAFASLGLVFVHLASHMLSVGRASTGGEVRLHTLNWRIGTHSAAVLLGSAFIIGVASVGYERALSTTATAPAVEPYALPYGPNPFAPSETRSANDGFVPMQAIADSDTCGTCHRHIFGEWSASLHGQAASDPTYVANVSLLAERNGIAATRYCEGCHAPVALLSGELSEGGLHGGIADTPAHHEGVGCMGCHGIDSAVHLEGVASYEYAPSGNYLFSHSRHPFAMRLRNFLIRVQPEAHRREMARPVLEQPELCATCHVQFMPESFNRWGWVKMQDEYSAWLASPFSGQHEQEFSKADVKRCQDCHMPKVAGADPSADEDGRIVSHRTLGSNTAIPWLNGDHTQFEAEKAFLQNGKLYLSIDAPWKQNASQSAKFVHEGVRSHAETPGYFYLGEQVRLSVNVTNASVGHHFPGGTTDINQVWIALSVVDAEDRAIFSSGAIDKNGSVDADAHFYRSLPIDRDGHLVWQHDLFNMVGDSYRKTIPAGESDVVSYDFEVPAWAKGPLVITATLRYRKFNKRYASWALGSEQIDLPVVDMARDAISVPVRIRPETAQLVGARSDHPAR
jgi:hypothetical protein